MKQDASPVKQPALCSPKTVAWIDITKKAMVPSYVSDRKTKINKTAKYEKIQQGGASVQPLFHCKSNTC